MKTTAKTTLKNHPRLLQALVTLTTLALLAMPVVAGSHSGNGP
ncbi:hypothetical protein [Salinirubrum litoreum]|uniref:Uncharacterized protein n=1 Tax=Salinirubrum litoreum TaxID=1126234 RepID=A0ABD5RBN9_9EURY|nr:hypothetical protein [Salinirubrum litoreum]